MSCDEESGTHFPKSVIGCTGYRNLGYTWVGEQLILNFRGVTIEAAANVHIF